MFKQGQIIKTNKQKKTENYHFFMKQTDTVSSVQFQNCHAVLSDINKDCGMNESYLEIKYTMLNETKNIIRPKKKHQLL